MKHLLILFCLAVVITGCTTAPQRPEAKQALSAEVKDAIAVFREKDPGIRKFFESSYGYAILPKVLKGAFWFGGGYGRGEVYEENTLVGYCDMSLATWGLSFGGEYFSEIIFFKTKDDIEKFKKGKYTFAAQATGIAATVGAAAKLDYKAGTMIFVTTDLGLMLDISLGGQSFTYISLESLEE